jgi:aminomethyltransferase
MTTQTSDLKRTPLASVHEALGAKMIDFGGWWMPVQYSGILAEHGATRAKVGLFDLSHMGEVEVRGDGALAYLQRLLTNDLARLSDGGAMYSPMCLETGGIVDDVVVYRFDARRYWVVVNASNIAKDLAWMRSQKRDRVEIADLSDTTALLAVQGPSSRRVLATLTDAPLDGLAYYAFLASASVAGVPVVLARTGYTGEPGYELFCRAEDAVLLWNRLHEAVAGVGGTPVGLGARDTLRLEMRYPLYGNELDETTTPLEAGLTWAVAFDKGGFVGREALSRQRADGVTRRLVGFRMETRGIARSHCGVFIGARRVGTVTSGAPSPTLGVNIGLAYVEPAFGRIGTRIEVEVREKRHRAVVVKTPFVSRSPR